MRCFGRFFASKHDYRSTSSVEIIGDRCFENCDLFAIMWFDEVSKLKRIEELAFSNCGLVSIRIPAWMEAIDGSACIRCPLVLIVIAGGSRSFKIQR
jgi:hypothetical protein